MQFENSRWGLTKALNKLRIVILSIYIIIVIFNEGIPESVPKHCFSREPLDMITDGHCTELLWPEYDEVAWGALPLDRHLKSHSDGL